MGNFQNISTNFPILQQNYNWKKKQSLGYCTIVQDISKNLIGQEYQLSITNINQQMIRYQYRKDISCYIVNVYSVQSQSFEYLCNANYHIKVICQRIIRRYAQLENVYFQMALFILFQVLQGTKIIHQNYGSVHYDDNMICFNTKRQVKVWLNQNLSRNYPNKDVNLTQKQVVSEIFTIIENRINYIPNRYFQLKKKSNISDFDRAIDFVAYVRRVFNNNNPNKVIHKLQQQLITPFEKRYQNHIKNQSLLKINRLNYPSQSLNKLHWNDYQLKQKQKPLKLIKDKFNFNQETSPKFSANLKNYNQKMYQNSQYPIKYEPQKTLIRGKNINFNKSMNWINQLQQISYNPQKIKITHKNKQPNRIEIQKKIKEKNTNTSQQRSSLPIYEETSQNTQIEQKVKIILNRPLISDKINKQRMSLLHIEPQSSYQEIRQKIISGNLY